MGLRRKRGDHLANGWSAKHYAFYEHSGRGKLADDSGEYHPFGSWLGHVRSWLGQRNVPIHLVFYERLLDDPASELESIFNFLGIRVPVERRRIAIERSSMKSMAALENKELENRVEGIFFRDSLALGYGKGHRFVNKGHRNSYEKLTTEERALADKIFGAEVGRFFGTRP
jgi:hypothetical protein